MLNDVTLRVIMLCVILLSIIIFNVTLLIVISLNVIMLSVAASLVDLTHQFTACLLQVLYFNVIVRQNMSFTGSPVAVFLAVFDPSVNEL